MSEQPAPYNHRLEGQIDALDIRYDRIGGLGGSHILR